MELGYPVGVRFHPTDQEIVDYYLQNRAALGDQFRSRMKNLSLSFTHRRKLSPTAKRFDRKVGSGTWSGQYSREVVAEDDHSVVIGIRREFRYEGVRNSRQNGAWLMQEYQITSGNDATTLVLCTLRKNPRKPPPPPTDQKRSVVKMTQG
ncbi:hypothetical protein M0R45_001175 [Rubus argutus]|uniref:NAC domain-containing protein n=1 Tax=Rubus argutus TaxID=59490 RepID=A0AAW1VMB0_RUBAR